MKGEWTIREESEWITTVLDGVTVLVPSFRPREISLRPTHLTTRVQTLALNRIHPSSTRGGHTVKKKKGDTKHRKRKMGKKVKSMVNTEGRVGQTNDPIPRKSTIHTVGQFTFARTLVEGVCIRQSLVSGRWRYCG